MDDYRQLAVFAAVARAGSMVAAGKALAMSTSAVSQHLRALERRHGVTLVHRTTRRVALTEAGQRLAAHCADMVAAAERARHQLAVSREVLEGELRLATPVGFAQHVAKALAPWLGNHPALRLTVFVDDEFIDLTEARIDLALRAGQLPDSPWAARRLADFRMLLCAAPAYLERHGTPADPEALTRQVWIGTERSAERPLRLRTADQPDAVLRIEPRAISNNLMTVQHMCVAGLGVASLVAMDAHDDLQAGRLVPVLPAWQQDVVPTWAMTPQRDGQPVKVRQAIEAVQGYLQTLPGIESAG